MPKVSVVVPVYGVENFIERCARSLFAQTLDDIEFIFIDDCTPDESLKILQSVIDVFPERAPNVHLVRMPQNSRLALVRSLGIQLATGDYIIHCDSDDWVDDTLYERMYNEAIRTNADVVICPICDEYEDKSIVRPKYELPATCNEVLVNWYQKSVGMFMWNKLVRRSINIENNLLPFEGVNMWEDNGLMLRVFYYAKGLSQIEGPVYHYNQANNKAMTNGYGRDAIDQMIRCAKLVGDFFDDKPDGEKYQKTVHALKYLAKLNLVTTRFDWLNEFHRLSPEANSAVHMIGLNAFSTKGKIRFLFVKYHLAWLFVLLFKVKELFSNHNR